MNSLALKHLSSIGYDVRFSCARIHGQYIWCNWSDVVIHYNFEDCPDRPQKLAKLVEAHSLLYETVGRQRRFIQVWPNANTDRCPVSGWSRTRIAPYPVAKPLLLQQIDLTPDYDKKPLDIFTSWTFSSGSGIRRYRMPITECAASHDWREITGGIYLRCKDRYGQTNETWRGKRTTGRIHNIAGPPFDNDVWRRYMSDFLIRAKVSWDSMGNDAAPYCHRFSECGWAGVCVIREGPVCEWYAPGIDYIVEEDPVKAFHLAFDVVRSGEWRHYATNLHNKWRTHESTEAVATFILRLLSEGV